MAEPAQFPKREPEREERTPRPNDDASRELVAAEMHPEPKPERPTEDVQARLDRLQDAANTTSAHVRNVYLTFLLFGLYLAIIFGSTTHEQLLRESPVTLPILDVGLPLVGFYWVAPALFVLLHLNLLLQLYLLSDKLHRLDYALDEAVERGHLQAERAEEERARLYPYPFSQMLIGRQHGRLMRFMLWLTVWLTVLVLPMVLLLAGQVRFLPYHDASTTMWHRILVTTDVLLVLIFWRPIYYSGQSRRWLWHQGKALPGTIVTLTLSWLIITFPGDSETFVSQGVSVPGEVEPSLWEEKVDFGDPMEEWLLEIAPESLIVPGETDLQLMLWPTRHLFDLTFLERNLVVAETNLVERLPTQVQIDQHGEDLAWQHFGTPPRLRGRDLRYADLSDSIFVHGDFRDVNLQGANLWGADLEAADLSKANLQDARLGSANLQEAHLTDADLQNAHFYRADLQGAELSAAAAEGASLLDVDLRGAGLWHANLQGTSFVGANLQGADFTGANLQGAVFWNAKLQGANFGTLKFQTTFATHPNFKGADLFANLPEVFGADLRGADLRGAQLWRALLDEYQDLSDRWVLVDLRGADVNPIDDPDVWIEEVARQTGDERTSHNVAQRLRWALRDEDRSEAPNFPKAWRSAPNIMFDPGDPLPHRLGWGARVWATEDAYDEDLAWFLGGLACGKDATVHVARGLGQRALDDRDRLYAKRLAARLTGGDCPAAAALPDDMRKSLEKLAAR